jgi:hypothetical protein
MWMNSFRIMARVRCMQPLTQNVIESAIDEGLLTEPFPPQSFL